MDLVKNKTLLIENGIKRHVNKNVNAHSERTPPHCVWPDGYSKLTSKIKKIFTFSLILDSNKSTMVLLNYFSFMRNISILFSSNLRKTQF